MSRENVDGDMNNVSTSAHASDRLRELETRAAAARSQEERDIVNREIRSTYRFTLVYAGDEAALVRKVLGSNAAERVLEFCRAAAA